MNCDKCVYTEIFYWEQDVNTGKAKPELWCERYREFCADIADCEYEDDGGRMRDGIAK